jgi:hypothetical protein
VKVFVALLLLSLCLIGIQALAADEQPAAAATTSSSSKPANAPFAIGIAARASTLGFGADVAVPVTRRSNARVGFNLFNYSRTFTKDQVSYAGQLTLRSVQTSYDLFPFGGNFHLSPGVLIYNGNKVNANASVPVSQTFSLGGVQYTATGTVSGTANLAMNKVAPTFMLGWGNLVPRSHRHVTFSVEGGFAYQGSPDVKLNLTGGNVCLNGATACANPISVATNTVQTNIAAEEKKLNNSISAFQFYPVVAIGFGYKF